MTTLIDVTVPDIGDYADVPVIDLLVRVGDSLGADTPIVTLESDKATMDVPSPLAGIVREIAIAPGDRVSRGTLLLRVESAAAASQPAPPSPPVTTSAAAAPAPAATTPAVDRTTPETPPPAPPAGPASARAHASPSVRRLARELGVDLARVAPADPKGRIAKDDVIAHVKATMLASTAAPVTAPTPSAPFDLLPWPTVDFARFGPVERRPRSRIQKLSAANLHRNWVLMPHVTNFDEADITELEAFRQQLNAEAGKDGARLTLLPFLIKAVVHTLQRYPAFNASLDGDDIVEKCYWHIGFAADTPNGLVVPVVRDADRKPLREIAAECADLAALARDGKLRPEQMQGGCFTVSSLGGIGGTGFTPIINAPEVAILGVTRSAIRPVWEGSAFVPRRMLPLCLSWDHRAVDGAAAARFLVHLAALLADFRRVAL